jgi:hypothetical protein
MSRSDNPSRPSASTCCFLSSLKTFTSARDHSPVAFVAVLDSCCYDWPVFRCPSLAGFGCPPRSRAVDGAGLGEDRRDAARRCLTACGTECAARTADQKVLRHAVRPCAHVGTDTVFSSGSVALARRRRSCGAGSWRTKTRRCSPLPDRMRNRMRRSNCRSKISSACRSFVCPRGHERSSPAAASRSRTRLSAVPLLVQQDTPLPAAVCPHEERMRRSNFRSKSASSCRSSACPRGHECEILQRRRRLAKQALVRHRFRWGTDTMQLAAACPQTEPTASACQRGRARERDHPSARSRCARGRAMRPCERARRRAPLRRAASPRRARRERPARAARMQLDRP